MVAAVVALLTALAGMLVPAGATVATATRADVLYPALIESTAQVHAGAAWSAGFTGAGQTIAVIDTGVDTAHPMVAGRVVAEACFTDAPGACPNGTRDQLGAGAAAPCAGSGCGHGTHVASVAAGAGQPSGLRGMAPGASLVAVQVFTSTPSGPVTSPEAVLRALDWLYAQRAGLAIAAINVSISSNRAESTPCADGGFAAAISRLRAVGIATVIAAGNQASSAGLAFPACVSGAVSVGSVGAQSASAFSNRGPALALFAPGETVTAAAPGGGTATISGTSTAAPHIAGALALMREREPDRPIDEIIGLLSRTADTVIDPVGGEPAPAGMVRLDRALDERYRAGASLPESIVRLDPLRAVPGAVVVSGYAVDARSVLPVAVTVTVDDRPVVTIPADQPGPVTAGYGGDHAFAFRAPLEGGARRVVCVDTRGPRDTAPRRAGCASFSGPAGPPFGALDVVTAHPRGARAEGWAIDPDTTEPVEMHFYADGALIRGALANRSRHDVGQTHESYGADHGFDAVVAVPPGARTLCAYAINSGDGDNALIGCRDLAPAGSHPFGSLDVVRAESDDVVVEGWALDLDTDAPIDVHVYVDGRLRAGGRADGPRPDVHRLFPLHGAFHSYEVRVPGAAAGSVVCVYGINAGPGENALIGCRAR